VARLLRDAGWQVSVEVTFSEYGERGAIDILALHPATRTALVIEVKTSIQSAEETLRRLDAKQRLAAKLVFDREGWRPATVARLLVVLEGSTNRRRVAAHAGLFVAAFPLRGDAARSWLRRPAGPCSALLFLSSSNPRGR
jgi:hypothetical protein